MSLLRIVNERIMSQQAITQLLAEYFKTQPVLKAWLFESFARDEHRKECFLFYKYNELLEKRPQTAQIKHTFISFDRFIS